jgi:glycosyltransferase involved in cell wall biosynthesis
MTKKITIGIDARLFGPTGKGLGRYIEEIINNLLYIAKDIKFVVFLNSSNFHLLAEAPNLEKVKVDIKWYGLKEQMMLPKIIKEKKIDLMHFPHFNVAIFCPCPYVVTIHDLILTKFPSIKASTLSALMYWFKHLMYKVVIKIAVLRAKKIITVSLFSKKDIINKLKVKDSKIVVTYEGVSKLENFNDKEDSVLKKYNLKSRYLLYIGNAYPHKNLDFLLQSLIKIRAKGDEIRLVLVGKDDYFYKQLKIKAEKLRIYRKYDIINSPVVFTAYVDDGQLKILYKNAFCYVFPSLYEGFGLPPLEAMSQSCLVLSSNQASLPEILSSSAIYFSPYSVDDFVDKYFYLKNNLEIKEKYIRRGHELIKKYSWQTCAQETLAVYKSCL